MFHRVPGIFTACILTAGLALAADKSTNDAKDLQGTWQAIGLEANGEALPEDQVKELRIVIKGDLIFAVKPSGEGPKSKFKLDPNKTPKTMDLSPLDPREQGKMAAGIYALKDGQLRVCINIFGRDTTQRPKDFKTEHGDGVGFATLERVKGK